LKAYDEDGSPCWTYTRALLTFRASGATRKAKALLANAVRSNEHVPAFLSGERERPTATPDCITLGGEDEAIEHARDCGAARRQTAGAVEWLRQTAAALPPPPPRGSQVVP
jgi:hypothetical protein